MTLPSPDRVVASPLRRARDTAAAFGCPVEIDERWVELDYGDLDGQDPTSVPDPVWARWRKESSFSPPGGESLDTLSSRVTAACAELSQEAVGSTVVVVTHVSPIKAALAWALDVPVGIAWRMYVEDASVSRIDIGADGPVVRWFNRADHPRVTERAEEGVGGLAPRGQRFPATARCGGEPGSPIVVVRQAAQRHAQAGDITRLHQAAFLVVVDQIGQVAAPPPDRRGGPRRSASANTVPYVST